MTEDRKLLWTGFLLFGILVSIVYAGVKTLSAGRILLTPVSTRAHAEGQFYYNEDSDTFEGHNAETEVTLNVGEEMWVFARNETGVTITNGQVVYISGAAGNKPSIALAKADAEATSTVIGVASHGIEHNSNGYVTVTGLVHDVNTSTFVAGDTLYLSEATAGLWTKVEPADPNRHVIVGYVLVVNPSVGVVLVSTQQQTPPGLDHVLGHEGAATRGSLVYGNASSIWAELPVGAANEVLSNDGTDVSWVAGFSESYAAVYLSTSAGAQTITPGTEEALDGTFTEVTSSSDWSVSAAGVITYTGTGATFNFGIHISSRISTANKDSIVFLAKNGTEIANSQMPRHHSTNSDLGNIGTIWTDTATTNDTYQIFVDIESGATALTAATAILTAQSTSGMTGATGPAGPSAQSVKLLDGSEHTDTVDSTVVRADIMVGNATPNWERLAKGAGGDYVGLDISATDVAWRSQLRHATMVGALIPRMDTATCSSWGQWQATYVDTTSTYGPDSFGSYFQQGSTGATECYTQAAFGTEGRNNWYYLCRITYAQLTDSRRFCGMVSSAATHNVCDSDTPAGPYIGFSYSTSNSDTNWQIMSDNTTTTPTRIDTGVACGTTAVHTLVLYTTNGGVTYNWKIWVGNTPLWSGAPTASGSTSTDVPPTDTDVGPVIITFPIASTKHHRFIYSEIGVNFPGD